MKLPTEVKILGVPHRIEYLDNPADVDRNKRQALWGQLDHWEKVIRIYKGNRPVESIWDAIFHEVLHGVSTALHLELNKDDKHDDLDLLALAIREILFSNEWLDKKYLDGA